MFKKIGEFFTKNGLLKILVAFILLIISAVILKSDPALIFKNIFGCIGWISLGYIILTGLIFLIVGIVNSFKKIR